MLAEQRVRRKAHSVRGVVLAAVNNLSVDNEHDRETLDLIHQLLSDRSPGGLHEE